MNDKKLIERVARCESILKQVESHAVTVTEMHDHMKHMIDHNKKLQADLKLIQQEEMQNKVIAMASKAAKKAAKKSIAKAKIKERLKLPEND